jgi:hypothetical protein
MELRNQTTGAVITESEFRSEHPNTSFPQVLTTEIIEYFGYDPVLEGPQPTLIPPYQYAQRDGVIEVNGQWFTHYIAVTPDDEQKAAMDAAQAASVRTERNRRLSESDWTRLDDTGLSVDLKAEWEVYRQSLRDISDQPGFPWDVQWPIAPGS